MSREIGLMFQDWGIRAMMLPPGTPGRKTQTRRVVKLPPAPNHLGEWEPVTLGGEGCYLDPQHTRPAPKVACLAHTRTGRTIRAPIQVGDTMYVKETWAPKSAAHGQCVAYRTDLMYQCGKRCPSEIEAVTKWHSSMMMPKKYARLRFPITGVRAECGAISIEDAIAEGCPLERLDDPVSWYIEVFESINSPGAMGKWRWVYEWE